MRDKRFFETQTRRPRRQSHPPAPSPTQLSHPAFVADGAVIDASSARLRTNFGRCQDAERAQLRDIRIEKNRLAAIARSDRAMHRHVIEMAKLERALEGTVFRLAVRVRERKKAVPTKRRKRADVAPVRRLPRMGFALLDRAGRRGIFVEVTSVGANQPRYSRGCCRMHLAYTWAENAVERLPSGVLSRCSNMGPTAELVAAAMDLKEDVARASRANANLEIRVIVRLPEDISPEARLQILKETCELFFGSNGLPYAAAVHPPDPHSDDRNYHGHIQAGFRPMRHVGGNEWEVGTELRTDLSRPDGMRLLRAVIATTMTEVARAEGLQRTYTSLSNQERGLAIKPVRKVGREQTEAFRRGEYVGVVEENVRILLDNLRRYAKQRLAWLKEASAGLSQPDIPDTERLLHHSDKPKLSPPQAIVQPSTAHVGLRAVVPVIPVRAAFTPTQKFVPLAQPTQASASRDSLSMAARTMLAAPTAAVPAYTLNAYMPISPKLIQPPLDVTPGQAPCARIAVPKPPLRAAAKSRDQAPDVDDALLLFQLRAAQKKERDTFAKRRRAVLDGYLFQRGDVGRPTPEYGAFLLAICDDPTLLRWELDIGGKRRAPALAGRDQAFQNRFAVYMQHPAVQRQVTAVFQRAYESGTAWPDELANGMWQYERGRYGHRRAVETRVGWAATDARIRETVAPSDARTLILWRVDDLIVPDLRQVLRRQDDDFVRLLYPSVQYDLTARWREQQEERTECLAAIANRTASIERRLIPVGTGRVRPMVRSETVPTVLADAFVRWRDDPDFYLDTAPESAAMMVAAQQVARCRDLLRRALQAARDGGDPPAVLRLLADHLAASRPNAEIVDESQGAPLTSDTHGAPLGLRGGAKRRGYSRKPRRS